MPDFELGGFQLEIADDFGPRITGLRHNGGPELLAHLDPDVAIDHPGGIYRFRGGHRLWASPELANITYAADDHECGITNEDNSVTISAKPDSAGLAKTIRITPDGHHLLVEHSVRGTGQLAAWAITQFPLGGVALLPLTGGETGPRPNRQMVIWPYTDPSDQRLRFTPQGVEIAATDGQPVKVGTGPSRVPLGYLQDGLLFMKEHVASSGTEIPDMGAGSQVYVGQGFCELETVGGLVDKAADDEATLTERWVVTPCADTGTAWQFMNDLDSS